MDSPRKTRVKTLIRPGLQLRLTFLFVGVAVTGLCLEFLLLAWIYGEVSFEFNSDPIRNHAILIDATLRGLLWTASVILPLTLMIGIVGTFRVAGPLHRMTDFLQQVAQGEAPSDCRLRKQDELQDFCKLVNLATAPLREQPAREAKLGAEETRGAA